MRIAEHDRFRLAKDFNGLKATVLVEVVSISKDGKDITVRSVMNGNKITVRAEDLVE